MAPISTNDAVASCPNHERFGHVRLLGRRSGLLYGAPSGALSPAQRAARYGLVAAWGLESDGTDSFGSNTLTTVGSPTFAAGKVGNGIHLVAASTQYAICADNAALNTSGFDWWGATWAKLTDKSTEYALIGKYELNGNQREWLLEYYSITNRYRLLVSSLGTDASKTVLEANTFGSPTAGAYALVMAYHRNGGAFDTAAHTGGTIDATGAFIAGAIGNGGAKIIPLNGDLDAACFGKLSSGGLSVALAGEIRDYIWNGSAGRQYPAGWT